MASLGRSSGPLSGWPVRDQFRRFRLRDENHRKMTKNVEGILIEDAPQRGYFFQGNDLVRGISSGSDLVRRGSFRDQNDFGPAVTFFNISSGSGLVRWAWGFISR